MLILKNLKTLQHVSIIIQIIFNCGDGAAAASQQLTFKKI